MGLHASPGVRTKAGSPKRAKRSAWGVAQFVREDNQMAGSEALKISKSPIRPQSTGRREQIIDAALKVMISNGVYNATTRKIAEAAGVNVATLHYHFHNKEEIIFSAIEELASRYRNTLSARFQKPQNIHDENTRSPVVYMGRD